MLGKLIEAAMSQAVVDTEKASDAIWASDLSERDKRERIAALNHPDSMRALALAYRAAVIVKWRERENVRSTVEAVGEIRKQSGAEARAE